MDEMLKQYNAIAAEMRGLLSAAKAEKRGLNDEEKKKYDELELRANELADTMRAEKRGIDQEAELRGLNLQAPKPQEKTGELRAMFLKAAEEKRGITISGTGAVSVIPEIVKAWGLKKDILKRFRYFYGANANTVIPTLTAYPATPAGQAEGATKADDTAAAIAAVTLAPKAYMSVLPVSAETMVMGGANIEAEIPGIFAEVFGEAVFDGVVNGAATTNAMSGLFVDTRITNNIQTAATGAPTWLDLAKLASKVRGYSDTAAIFINPDFINGILASGTTDPLANEYLTKGTIRGVQIVETAKAPVVTTTGARLAVALDPVNFGIGIAQQIETDPIKVKGDPSTYFQSTMFIDGKVINPANVWLLKSK